MNKTYVVSAPTGASLARETGSKPSHDAPCCQSGTAQEVRVGTREAGKGEPALPPGSDVPSSCAVGPGRLSVLLIHITAGNGQMNHRKPQKIPQPHLSQ